MSSESVALGYQYVTLRLVPRVEREEFVNVGVVLYCQRAEFLDVATHLDRARLEVLAPDLDLAAVADALDAVRGACREQTSPVGPQDSTLGARFGWLAAPRSTVVQPGPVHGGLTHEPRRELERLLVRMTG